MAVIDLHCHVLPGVDDGPADMGQSIALLNAQQTAGVTTVLATSHVGYAYPHVTAALVAERVRDVRDAAAAEGIEVDVVAGAEVSLTRAVDLADDELAALRLGDGPWLLLEPPHQPTAVSTIESAIVSLQRRGHRVLLAHPERCPAFQQDGDVLQRLVAGGVRCSVTASALSGAFGRTVRRFALDLFAEGMVHNIASDAHGGMASRPAGLTEHLAGTGYEALAPWLCDEVPRALLAGDDLPPAPALPPAPRRGGIARLLRRD